VRSPGARAHSPAMPPETATEIHMAGFDKGPLKYLKFKLGKKSSATPIRTSRTWKAR
jgi:hypothetical protein